MWDDDEDEIRGGKWVSWRDSRNEEIYGSGHGPFRVVRVYKDKWVPFCTCGGQGGGLLDDGHSHRCAIRAKETGGDVVVVQMNGRHRSFHEDMFEVVK